MSEINKEKMIQIVDAAEKLVRCKGRYHSEQNYRALAALFGVTTPDLPPLESDVMRERAEPFAWMTTREGDASFPRLHKEEAQADHLVNYCTVAPAIVKRPLYTAPPAPVVPEEMPKPDTSKMFVADAVAAISRAEGWNACREAMLAEPGKN
ncbi:hypothetical protein C5973_13945 [Cronobacter sakazakii]|nr:hypothetical protein C5973_13945 [Cronobacter sakazakii]